MLLGLFESPAATDELRVAAFLALRKLAVSSDHALREQVLKVRVLPRFLHVHISNDTLEIQ